MELMICQNCGSLLRPRRRDCSACGGLVSRYSPTNLIALKAGGPQEKCIPAPPNDHLLLERVVTLRTTDRLSETSPCRGKKNCNHGVDGKHDDDAAGSVVAARSFTFGAALDGNVVSARSDGAGGSGPELDTAGGASSNAGATDDEMAESYDRAQRESAIRSRMTTTPGGEFADKASDHSQQESSTSSDFGSSKDEGDRSKSKKKSSTAEALDSKGSVSSVSGSGNGTKNAQSKLLSKVDLANDSSRQPPLKMVFIAGALGILVLATAFFTFLKPSAAPQQAQSTPNASSFNLPSSPNFSAQPNDPQFAGIMPPNVAGNWKVQVVFPGADGQPLAQEFIASVRQSSVAIEGRGADSGGPFSIRGTLSVNLPYTIEFQKAYDANSAALPINCKGELVDDQVRIGSGQCVMRIARGGGVLARARSDMLVGTWSAERTSQAPAPASQFPQPGGSNVTAILGVLLAVGISVFMFLKQRGLLPGKGGTMTRGEPVRKGKTNAYEKPSGKGKTSASDEPEELTSDESEKTAPIEPEQLHSDDR